MDPSDGYNSDEEVSKLWQDEESESEQHASLGHFRREIFHWMNVEEGTNYSLIIDNPEEKKMAEEIKKRYEGTNERWYMHLDDEDDEDQQDTQERNSIANVAERLKGKNKLGFFQESGWVSSKKMGEEENKDKETAPSSESKRPRINLLYKGVRLRLGQSFEKRTKGNNDKMTEMEMEMETTASSPSPPVTKSNNRPRIEITDKEEMPAENNAQQTEPATPPAPASNRPRIKLKWEKRDLNIKRDDDV